MKIVKLEDFHVDCGWEDYSFRKITTDEGLVGWSEFRESRREGKRAVRSRDDLKRAVREGAARGIKAAKMNLLVFDQKGGRQYTPASARGPGFPELNLPEDVLAALLDQIAAVREGAGPKFGIAIDLNFNYKAESFRRIAKKVEPFELMWLEMDIYEPKALALIRQSTTTPIASLETILGRRALIPYLDARCTDVAIIDPQYNGLVESVRMAALCDAYEVNVASHYFSGPLSA